LISSSVTFGDSFSAGEAFDTNRLLLLLTF